jgi:hypothetical protein
MGSTADNFHSVNGFLHRISGNLELVFRTLKVVIEYVGLHFQFPSFCRSVSSGRLGMVFPYKVAASNNAVPILKLDQATVHLATCENAT